MFFIARRKALRSSPAGEPRQGVKVCGLLNAGSVPLRYMLRINTAKPMLLDHQGSDLFKKLLTSGFAVQEEHRANVGTIPQTPNR